MPGEGTTGHNLEHFILNTCIVLYIIFMRLYEDNRRSESIDTLTKGILGDPVYLTQGPCPNDGAKGQNIKQL